jgi:rare lipoprotein A (peptidoglycan hydrolase)
MRMLEKVRKKTGANKLLRDCDMKKVIETILIAMLVFIIMIAIFTGSSKADCFPCFENNPAQQVVRGQQTVAKKFKKSKTSRTGKKSLQVAERGSSHGMASYYWQPQRVASGGMFNPNALTAAHRTYPFGTRVKVTNVRNGLSVFVTINDRGPFIRGRIIDLSLAAAKAIQMTKSGVVPVTVERN